VAIDNPAKTKLVSDDERERKPETLSSFASNASKMDKKTGLYNGGSPVKHAF